MSAEMQTQEVVSETIESIETAGNPLSVVHDQPVAVGQGVAHGEWNLQYVSDAVIAGVTPDPDMLTALEDKGLSPTSDHPHFITCTDAEAYQADETKRHPLVYGYIHIKPGGHLTISSYNHGTLRLETPGFWAIRAQRDGEVQSHGVMVVNVD